MHLSRILIARPVLRCSRVPGRRAVAGGATAAGAVAVGAAPGRRAVGHHAGGLPQSEGESAAWRGTLARVARKRRGHRNRPDACLRYRMELLLAGHGLRGGCRPRPDPHESSRGHAGTGDCRGDVPQSRRSAALPGVSRSDPRFRHLSLRPEEAALHQAAFAAAVSGRRADRPRDPRDRQQRRRAALDPRRHARQARSRRTRIRHRQVQRLQYLLPAGSLGHFRWLLGFAGHRHPGTRDCAQRGRRHRRGLQLLSTARPREARARADPGRARPFRAARCRWCSSTRRTTSCADSGSTRKPKRPRASHSPRSPACWWSTKCCPAGPPTARCSPATCWCA